MCKQAFLFPGQGSQFDEMGFDWCREFSAARRIYEEAGDLLGFNVLKLSNEGLAFHQSTRKSQLAVFTHSMAIWNVFRDQGIIQKPICTGMSLGEFSALVAAEKAEFCDILPLIDQRAHLMQLACAELNSGMAAVLGIKAERVQQVVKDSNCSEEIWIANLNAPTQIVISGRNEGLNRVNQALFQAGGRVHRLNVAGAFHTPLMNTAQQRWSIQWQRLTLKNSSVEFVSSISGKKEEDNFHLHTLIGQQMTQPVLWTAVAREIQAEKPSISFELGSRVLKGLQKRIDQTVEIISIQSVKDLAQLAKANKFVH